MLPFTQIPSLKNPSVQKDMAVLLGIVVACAVPFLNQAFHMDDNFYMDMAHNVPAQPMFPNDLPYVFHGKALPDMGSHSHPPLQTYFLATLQTLIGEGQGREWAYHLCALVFPLIAVLAMYFLAARFVERPIWPSLSLAVSPLFLVMQHNLMTDVPTLAFWLGSIAAFLWALELGRKSLYVVSAIFLVAAAFSSYQSAALLPLLGFYHWRKGKGAQGWIVLLVPLLTLSTWLGLGYAHYHRLLLWDTLGYIQSRNPTALASLKTKLIALFEYQGWLAIFPFFLLLVFARNLKGRLFGLFAVASVYSAQWLVASYGVLEKAIFVVGLVAGASVVCRLLVFLVEAFFKKDPEVGFEILDAQFLGLWYAGVLGYCLFIFTEGSARYVLPLVPPFLLCFFRTLEVMEIQEYRRGRRWFMNSSMIATGAPILSLGFGLLLSHADAEFARVYPKVARDVLHAAGSLKTYYAGEWGFRYYLERAGIGQVQVDESQVDGGSLIAYPTLALPYDLPAGLQSMLMTFATLDYQIRTPLRILDGQSHAAFYSTGWGLLPFSFSRNRIELVEVKQVNFMVQRLPWARIETTSSVLPWPGYLKLQGEDHLAVLARPDSRLIYSWTAQVPLVLQVKYGISPDAYDDGQDSSFGFDIRQCDARGGVLSNHNRILEPGRRREDRTWQSVRIPLRDHREGGELLEFGYSTRGWKGTGTGAFAEAYLRPAGSEKGAR